MFDLTIEFWHIVILAALIVGYGEIRANYTKVLLEATRLELLAAIKEINESLDINSLKTIRNILLVLVKSGLLYIDAKGNLIGFRNKIVTTEQMQKEIEKYQTVNK